MHILLGTTIGVGISLSVSAIDSIGVNILRKDHLAQSALPEYLHRSVFRRWRAVLGMSMHIVSQLIGGPTQLAFLQPSVMAPLGSASLIFNMIFARIFVGTHITRLDVLGTLVMIVGGCLVAVFGTTEKEKMDLERMMHLFRRPFFIVYFSILDAACLALFLTAKFCERRYVREKRLWELEKLDLPDDAADIDIADEDKDDIRRGESTRLSRLRKLVGAGYSATGAILASQSVLLSDTCVGLLKTSFHGNNQFTSIEPFLLLFTLAFGGIAQVYCTNAAVSRCETIITAPVFFTFFSVLTLANDIVYSDKHLSPLMIGMFLLGVALLIAGIAMISTSKRKLDAEDPQSPDGPAMAAHVVFYSPDEVVIDGMRKGHTIGEDLDGGMSTLMESSMESPEDSLETSALLLHSKEH